MSVLRPASAERHYFSRPATAKCRRDAGPPPAPRDCSRSRGRGDTFRVSSSQHTRGKEKHHEKERNTRETGGWMQQQRAAAGDRGLEDSVHSFLSTDAAHRRHALQSGPTDAPSQPKALHVGLVFPQAHEPCCSARVHAPGVSVAFAGISAGWGAIRSYRSCSGTR